MMRSLVLIALAVTLIGRQAHADESNADAAPEYGLDLIERQVPASGAMHCPKVPMVTYRGGAVRYHSAVRVYAGFGDRLALFDEVVRDVAIEVYGRPPKQLRHIGTFNCRRIRLWPTLLSEHGIGNGIDIAGFDFGPLKKGQALPDGTPAKLRRPFEVRVKGHWNAEGQIVGVHAKFLRLLTERLRQRPDIFRVMLGPAYPGHKDHFHFDCAPWRMVVL